MIKRKFQLLCLQVFKTQFSAVSKRDKADQIIADTILFIQALLDDLLGRENYKHQLLDIKNVFSQLCIKVYTFSQNNNTGTGIQSIIC